MSFTEDLKTLLNWLVPPPRPSAEEVAAVENAQRRELARREEDAHQKIATYPRSHWQPLLDLLPEIEAMERRGETFGEWKGGEKDGSGAIQFPWIDEAPIVHRVSGQFTDLGGFVSFDWPNWEEGRRIASDATFDFDSVDIFTKCKLLSALIRSSRFNEGALAAAFTSGLVTRLLKSMDRQLQ